MRVLTVIRDQAVADEMREMYEASEAWMVAHNSRAPASANKGYQCDTLSDSRKWVPGVVTTDVYI